MKTKFFSLASAAALLLGLSACHEPYEFTPTEYDEHFNSMTACFLDDDRDENSFPAEFDYANHIITIVIPYTYPPGTDSYLEPADITNMKLVCNLKTGMTIDPPLTTLDLSKDNHITLTDNFGVSTPYIIRGEIRKSNLCEITDFAIPTADVPAIINPLTHQIKLVTEETVGSHLAVVELSHGATLDPDPRVQPIDFDADPQITVIAQNGTDKCVYSIIKATPTKLPFGIREGSEKILWAKKQADMGVQIYNSAEIKEGNLRFNGSAGLGVVGDYLVMNEAGKGKAYVMNYKNGTVVKTIDLSAMGTNSLGQYNNHRMTSDNNGNLLFTSAANFNGGTLTIWKMKGVDGQLEKLITYANGAAIGSSISVTGNIEGDAIITVNNNGPTQFYRWQVKNGVIGNVETVVPSGYAANCWGNFDAVYLEPTLPSDYISIGYVAFTTLPPTAHDADNRTCAWHNGETNAIKSFGNTCITSNSVENSGDITTFNNVRYYIHNVMNTLGYGYGASLFMYNLSTNDLSTPEIDFSSNGRLNFRNTYGASTASSTNDRAGNGGDVRFFVSPDGFYLYIFFEFCNGYVGAVRADCIDLNA